MPNSGHKSKRQEIIESNYGAEDVSYQNKDFSEDKDLFMDENEFIDKSAVDKI